MKKSNWGRYLTFTSSVHKVICLCLQWHIDASAHTHNSHPYTSNSHTLHTYINMHMKTLKIVHHILHIQKAKSVLLPQNTFQKAHEAAVNVYPFCTLHNKMPRSIFYSDWSYEMLKGKTLFLSNASGRCCTEAIPSWRVT